jgi:REP element-mobilizing transposase RayT
MNRGIARRTLFERREDFRFFAAQLARAVRRGEIEVHAFCLMGTHYHLLVRSPRGELAKAMWRIQQTYSRFFNRTRRRDGSLVRGRYTSKPVKSVAYRFALVRYIDRNACKAHVVQHPFEYPYGSAALYRRPSGPRWLERSWVEELVASRSGGACYEPASYARAFTTLPDHMVGLVEERSSSAVGFDPLDNLVVASSDTVREWMVCKARLADGTEPNLPILSLGQLALLVNADRHRSWRIERGQVERDAWPVAYAGLGRRLCGASLTLLASDMNLSHATVSKLCRLHEREVGLDGDYARRCALLTHAALEEWA